MKKKLLIGINILLLPLTSLLIYRAIVNNLPVTEDVELDYKNTINITGMIGPNMEQVVNQITQLTQSGETEINIVINSPGGRLDSGLLVMEAMDNARYFGVKFNCYVQGAAMSMATIILTNCDTRYATFDSKVMWHSVAMYGFAKVNADFLEKMAVIVNTQNSQMWASTRHYFFPWYFSANFIEERQIPAIEVEANGFGYLRVIRKLSMIGIPIFAPIHGGEEGLVINGGKINVPAKKEQTPGKTTNPNHRAPKSTAP